MSTQTQHHFLPCKFFRIVFSVCSVIMTQAATSEPTIPVDLDISKWDCNYCAYVYGWRGEIELGFGNLSDSALKYGKYNGLYEEGVFGIANARADYTNEKGQFFNLNLRNLALDNASANISGGVQGDFEIYFNYKELLTTEGHQLSSVFTNSGSENLALPNDWTAIGQSGDVNTPLFPVDLQTDRQRFNLGGLFIPAKHWEASIDFQRDKRSGNKRTAGAFFFNSVEMLEPVDYLTDEVELSATYTNRKLQSRFSFYASTFKNDKPSLTWPNVFGQIVSGADRGQLALPPDNSFQQVRFTSGYQIGKTRISGDIASGSMSQNVDFLAPTLNDQILVQLPQESADVKVDTLTGSLRVNTTVNQKLQLVASYRLNERDNKTESLLYSFVTTDGFAGGMRRNLPYSFRTESYNAEGVWRLNRVAKVSMGYDFDVRERSYQEVKKTEEDIGWAKLRIRASNKLDLQFRYSKAQRDASGYNQIAEIEPGQNILMRKYNMADRDRSSSFAGASFYLHERVTIDVSVDSSRDHYTDSLIGLTRARDLTLNGDIAVAFSDALSGHLFATREKIQSKQVGSQSFSYPDWYSQNKDIIGTVGCGVNYSLNKEKITLSANYIESDSASDITVITYSVNGIYPPLTTNFRSFEANIDYALSETLTLTASAAYQRYEVEDWQTDDLTFNALTNQVGIGYNDLNYSLSAIIGSIRYSF